MTIDKSLKVRRGATRNRSVLTRVERIARLQQADRWKEGDSPLGLPKVRVRLGRGASMETQAAPTRRLQEHSQPRWAALMAASTRGAVIGVSFTSAPIVARASRTAFAIAAGGATAPPSPIPFMPYSVAVAGLCRCPIRIGGSSKEAVAALGDVVGEVGGDETDQAHTVEAAELRDGEIGDDDVEAEAAEQRLRGLDFPAGGQRQAGQPQVGRQGVDHDRLVVEDQYPKHASASP